MLGNFHDNVINIECETNSADLYVVDAEGVYIENIAMHSYLESDVIDAINAKYGTNFTHITMQKVTGIAIGDDCPNWNAYEKISNLRWQIQFAGTNGVFGIIENNTFKVYANNASNVLISSNEGVVVGTQNYSSDFGNFMKNKLIAAGIDVQSVEQFITSLNVGDNVPDWSLYNITN